MVQPLDFFGADYFTFAFLDVLGRILLFKFVITFFQIALVSDIPELEDPLVIIQYAILGVLPAAFIAFILYKYCVKQTLGAVEARIDRTFLWLVGVWIGSLENYTIDKLPIRRLTPQDVGQQPEAIVVLIIIVLLILGVGAYQA